MPWIPIDKPGDISKGEKVKGINFTYSQKYTLLDGYEKYNEIREGIVVSEYHDSFFDIKIKKMDGEVEDLVYNPGNSGEYFVEKWI